MSSDVSGPVHFPATFCTESSQPLLRILSESVHLLPPQCLLPRVSKQHFPAKVEPEWLKLVRLLVRKDAAVSVGEASLPVLRKGSGQAAVPTFTLDRRVAVGHSLPCIGVGDFTAYLPHSFVLVAGLAVCGPI